jgi:hypothetical protein
VKILVSVAPLFLSLEKKEVAAVIVQLELDNEGKDDCNDTKDLKVIKKGVEFIQIHQFGLTTFLPFDDIDYHFISKEYIKSFFPSVPTPPPNQA